MDRILFILNTTTQVELFSILMNSVDNKGYCEVPIEKILYICCKNKTGKVFPRRVKTNMNTLEKKNIVKWWDFIEEDNLVKVF